jgi:RimJ/RimL family protein N-acetyltransferase
LATAAVNLVTTYAFEKLAVTSIEAMIHEDNLSSIRVAEKAKFTKSKTLNNLTVTSQLATGQVLYTLIQK